MMMMVVMMMMIMMKVDMEHDGLELQSLSRGHSRR